MKKRKTIIIMNKIINFIKKEAVLVVSLLLCVVSMLFVSPRKEYIDYIDIRTLVLLFCLMAIMAGLKQLGVFDLIAKSLLSKAKKSYHIYFILILLCFFSSMIITNDVALITFVPFTIITLKMANQQKRLIYIVAMETIAANLGSMLTPIGNPQNLFLFSSFNLSGKDFFGAIFPYSLLSLILLLIGGAFAGKDEIKAQENDKKITDKPWLIGVYCVLFLLSILSVFKILPYEILLEIILISLILADRNCFKKIDYSLLFTFVFLFIFIGNLGKIEAVSNLLSKIISGNEVLVGVLASQVFSNVPACILLSGFTTDATALLVGVNLGGLGTLIASMASLISYKFIQRENVKGGKYLLIFSVLNIIFLALNLALWAIIK